MLEKIFRSFFIQTTFRYGVGGGREGGGEGGGGRGGENEEEDGTEGGFGD